VNRVIGDLLFDPAESDKEFEVALSFFLWKMDLERGKEPAPSTLS
jgi:hypothetical protein